MKIYKIANTLGGIDKNTLIVGKIKTIEEAKRICKNSQAKSLPNPGYEVLVDSGIVKLDYKATSYLDKPFTYERNDENGVPRKYKTYLTNEAGTFRVWTWIGMDIKQAQTKSFIIPSVTDFKDPKLMKKLEEAYFNAWEARKQYNMGEHMMINPSLKTNTIGRAWLRGWNDSANGKPKQMPVDLLEYVKSDEEIKIQ